MRAARTPDSRPDPERSYSELSKFHTFDERFEYLRLRGVLGEATFGFDRWINQQFYRSYEWKQARSVVIARDNGCDLGVDGYEIHHGILIHHINPIVSGDILHSEESLFDPDNLITTTHMTHNAIHYGRVSNLPKVVTERRPNDTRLW